MRSHLYEVWQSRGEGIHRGPGFCHMRDALAYVEEHIEEASFAVRKPDGQWYRLPGTARCVFPRQEDARSAYTTIISGRRYRSEA